MNKKDKFVLLVQTGAIVRDVQTGRSLAVACVEGAINIPEENIPDAEELSGEVRKYLNWQYGVLIMGKEARKPEWCE